MLRPYGSNPTFRTHFQRVALWIRRDVLKSQGLLCEVLLRKGLPAYQRNRLPGGQPAFASDSERAPLLHGPPQSLQILRGPCGRLRDPDATVVVNPRKAATLTSPI